MILYLESEKIKLEISALEGKILLGRADDNMYILDDPSVSRHHLEIYFRGNKGWTIRDLDSSAGTFLNGTRVKEPVELNIGDRLKIGALKFTVHFKGGDDVPQVSTEVRTKVLQEESAKKSAEIAMNKGRDAKTSMIPARSEEVEESQSRKPRVQPSGTPWLILILITFGLAVGGFLAFKMMTEPSPHAIPEKAPDTAPAPEPAK